MAILQNLANSLGLADKFLDLKRVLGISDNPMVFSTTSQDLRRSTQIASQEQSRGYYKGIDTSPFKSQLLGEVKSSLGLNYEDAQIAAYQRGMQAGGPQLAATMGNKPALSDVDFTGGLKNASGAVSRAFSSQVGKSISENIEPTKLSQIEANNNQLFIGQDSASQLIQEAKKYKSAEEFIKAQGTPVYHGTAGKFDVFDDKMTGSVTGAKSAHGATWFTDSPEVAKAYSIYAAESGLINKLQRQADELDKIARKTGKESDWLKYDKIVEEMEKLDTYEANFKRRELANVKEAILEGDFYKVNAKGKTPQELSADGDIDSWLSLQVKKAKDLKKDGLIIENIDDAVGLYDKPSTHYAVFDAKQIKTKSQLQDIWNKAHSNLPGFTTKEALVVGGVLSSLTVGGLTLATALGIKPKDSLQSSLDMPDKYEDNTAILKKPRYLESGQIDNIVGRVKYWDTWSKQYPESYQSLKSAAERVEKEIGVPAEILIDISGIETSGGHSLIQNSGGPGRGYFQFEMPLPSDIKKIADRLFNNKFDPFDAYQSARLAGELIKNRNLSRWGKFGGSWGSVDNQTRDKNERLTTYYSKEELSKYLK